MLLTLKTPEDLEAHITKNEQSFNLSRSKHGKLTGRLKACMKPFMALSDIISAAVSASPGAGAELWLRTCLVDDEGSTLHLKLVKFGNRPLSVFVRTHLHEGKTPGSTGCHIAHDSNALHRTGAAEQSVQLLIGGAVGKVANVEPTTHLLWFPGSVRGLHSNGTHPRARVIRSSGRLLVPARAGRLIPAQHNAGLPLLGRWDCNSVPPKSQPIRNPFVSILA